MKEINQIYAEQSETNQNEVGKNIFFGNNGNNLQLSQGPKSTDQ